MGFPGGSVGKESACNIGELGSIPGSGRSPGEGKSNLRQYSGLENSIDRGAWQAPDPFMGSQSLTLLSDFHCSWYCSTAELNGLPWWLRG